MHFFKKLTPFGAKIILCFTTMHRTVRRCATVNLKAVETIAGYAEVKFIQPAVKGNAG